MGGHGRPREATFYTFAMRLRQQHGRTGRGGAAELMTILGDDFANFLLLVVSYFFWNGHFQFSAHAMASTASASQRPPRCQRPH